jgi:hypothetical protein
MRRALPCKEHAFDISEEDLNRFFKFAFVRNPWDRALSVYKFFYITPEENTKRPKFKDMMARRRERVFGKRHLTFEEFIYRLPHSKDHHVAPCSDFIPENVSMDYIGRVENLSEDLIIILNKIDKLEKYDFDYKIYKKNNYIKYYNNINMIDIVSKVYKKDINHFGYKFGE